MILYRFLRAFFSGYLRTMHRMKICGRERIPAAGPVIICANHSSYFDAMLITLCTPRLVRFMVARDFYDHPVLGFFIKRAGGIPVSLSGVDAAACKTALAVLKEGGIVSIFPEGRLSRTGLPSSARPGAAFLAAASDAPIVPVSVTGAFFCYPRGRRLPRPGQIRVTVHAALTVDNRQKRDPGFLRYLTNRVMAVIGRRVRGYYRLRGKKRRNVMPSVSQKVSPGKR